MATDVKASVQTGTISGPEDESLSDRPLTPKHGANTSPSEKKALFSWFDKNDGPLERRLVLKLDLAILSFSFLSFWVSVSKNVQLSAVANRKNVRLCILIEASSRTHTSVECVRR